MEHSASSRSGLQPCTVRFDTSVCLQSFYNTETGTSKFVILPILRCSCGRQRYLSTGIPTHFKQRLDAAFPLTSPVVRGIASQGAALVPTDLADLALRIGDKIIDALQISNDCGTLSTIPVEPMERWSTQPFKQVDMDDDPDLFIESFLAVRPITSRHLATTLRDAARGMTQHLRSQCRAEVRHDHWECAIRRSLESTFADMWSRCQRPASSNARLECTMWHQVNRAPASRQWERAGRVQFMISSRGVLDAEGVVPQTPVSVLDTAVYENQAAGELRHFEYDQ